MVDRRSALSAIKLRGHAGPTGRKTVLNKASRYASSHHDAVVASAVTRARKADA